MTVRAKALAILVVTLGALSAVVYLISTQIVLKSFARLEVEDARSDVRRVVSALNGELENLLAFTVDWAWWDDTYEFVANPTSDYVSSNLVDSTFSDARLNAIMFLDVSGRVVWGQGYDLEEDQRGPWPEGLEEDIDDLSSLVLDTVGPGGTAGIRVLSGQPMLMAAVPILTSDREGPARGVLVMVRLLNDAEVGRLRERTHLDFLVLPLEGGTDPSREKQATGAGPSEEPVIRIVSDQALVGHALVPDLFGKPAMAIHLDLPRTIYGKGRATVLYLLAAIVASGLALIAVAWLLLDRTLLARLKRLGSEVQAIRASADVSTRVNVGGGDEVGVLAGDINQTLEALEQSQRLLRERERTEQAVKLLDGLPAYAFLKDAEGRYITANRLFCDAIGRSVEEVMGRVESDLFPPDVAARNVEAQRSLFESCEAIWVGEEQFRDGDRMVPVTTRLVPVRDEDGAVAGLVGLKFDTTELKRAHEHLARLATAVDQTAEMVVMTDLQGVIQYVNPAFQRTTGYSSVEVVGQHVRMLGSGQHEPGFFEELWATLERGEEWRGRFINRKKDGMLNEVDSTISPVREKTGRAVGYVAVQRDVTRESALERRLRQTQKLEALGTLAGGIAHDFNNILTPIMFAAEMGLRDELPGGKLESFLRQIVRGTVRARDLVQQILTFSRQSEQEKRVVLLAPILKEAVKFTRASLPPHIEIRSSVDADRAAVLADPGQIHQILVNLATNAAQAIGERAGVIEVTLSEVPVGRAPLSQHAGLQNAPHVKIEVRDTGSGMTEEVKERMFEPFFTTKPPGEGTGIGLSVVHGIVEGCGGVIEVESSPGRGTTIRVFLPKAEATSEALTDVEMAVAKGAERILLVDDEQDTINMASEALRSSGYRVTGVTDPTEALRLFRETPEDFDLVVTDQAMPGMTGTDLAREMFAVRPDTPIILFTGYGAGITQEKAESVGIRHLLSKPLRILEMEEAIREALTDRVPGKMTFTSPLEGNRARGRDVASGSCPTRNARSGSSR